MSEGSAAGVEELGEGIDIGGVAEVEAADEEGKVGEFGMRSRGEDVSVPSGLAGSDDALVEASARKGHGSDGSAQLVLQGEARLLQLSAECHVVAVG